MFFAEFSDTPKKPVPLPAVPAPRRSKDFWHGLGSMFRAKSTFGSITWIGWTSEMNILPKKSNRLENSKDIDWMTTDMIWHSRLGVCVQFHLLFGPIATQCKSKKNSYPLFTRSILARARRMSFAISIILYITTQNHTSMHSSTLKIYSDNKVASQIM